MFDFPKQVSARYTLALNDFELLVCVGEGSFGKVYKVRMRQTGKIYAMKVLEKRTLRTEKDVNDVLSELRVMQSLDHPFIVQLHCSFQTEDRLYMIMDFLAGGEVPMPLVLVSLSRVGWAGLRRAQMARDAM